MSRPRLYVGRALDSSASMIAASVAVALALALGVFLACAWPYVERLQP